MTSFADTLRAIRHPEHWDLQVDSMEEDGPEPERIHCPGKEDDPAAFLTDAGVADGKYRICLEPADRGQADSTKSSAKGRLRKHGPLSTIVEVGIPNGPLLTRGPATRTTGAARVPPRAAPLSQAATASAVRVQEITNKAAELRAEMELRRVERDFEATMSGSAAAAPGWELAYTRLEARFDRLSDQLQQQQQASNAPDFATLLTAIAPFVQAFQANATRRDELFLGLLGTSGEQAQGPGGLATVQGTMDLTKSFLEMVNQYGGGGDGGGGGGMLGDVASIIRNLQVPLPGQAPPAMQPQPTGRAAKRKAPSPEEDTRMRVLMFLDQVYRFASQDADPEATADALEGAFGLLPENFRRLVEGTNVDALVGGLPRWMPRTHYDRFTAYLAQNPNKRQWLERFQSAMRGDDEDAVVADTQPGPAESFEDLIDPDVAAAADAGADFAFDGEVDVNRGADPFGEEPSQDPFEQEGPVGPEKNGPAAEAAPAWTPPGQSRGI